MSESSKKAADVGRGYTGLSRAQIGRSVNYITGGRFVAAGQDLTGVNVNSRLNAVNKNARAEKTDRQKRREAGYRGL